MIDKDIEKHRYDNRANIFLDSNNLYHFDKIPTYLNTPYQYYFHLLKRKSGQSKLLEIGAGMGENTSSLLDMSFKVTSTDISSKSVEVMRNRFSKYSNFSVEVADMEKLPFNNESFEMVLYLILVDLVLIPSFYTTNEYYYLFIIDGLLVLFPIFAIW